MFFSVITKNLNREILTKNLVTFTRCDVMGLRMKKFNIMEGFTEKSNSQGEGS